MTSRRRPSPPGRETLTRERVLQAAMALADEAGLEALTMRELGRRLTVEAASLYNHVQGKDDLLDGLVELVVEEIRWADDPADWKSTMRHRAHAARLVFARHPWASGLIDSRGALGAARLAYVERVLGTLLGAGFGTGDAARAFVVIDSYIYGFERQRSELGMGSEGQTDASAEAAEAVLAELPPGGFPSVARIAEAFAATPFDDAAVFEFGLGLILDGLAARLATGARDS